MRKLFAVISLALISVHGIAQQGSEPVKVTDMLKIRAIGGIKLSPDGSKAVFTVTSIEPDGESKVEYKYVNQVWIVNTEENTPPRQLTGHEGSSQAEFSPDGRQIAFVRQADNKPQVFLLSMDGGEAIQLTKFKYGAGNPKWSPDGKQILFSSNIPMMELLKDSILNPGKRGPVWPVEKPGMENTELFRQPGVKPNPDGNMEEIRAYLDNDVTDNKARVINKLNFQDESDINAEISFNHYFITDVAPGAVPIALTHGFYLFNSADFTPDGKQVILAGDIDSLQQPDRSQENEIFLVNSDGSNLQLLLGEEGKNINSPRVSPTGKWLAFQYARVGEVNVPALAVIPMKGTLKDKIDLPFDRNKSNLTWSRDEKYIYFIAQSNGGAPLYRVNLSTHKPEQITRGYDYGVLNFDLSANQLVYVKTEVNDPFELYRCGMDGKDAQAISSINSSWVSSRKLSVPEKHSFNNEKGMIVEYWVMKPANYEPGKKFPLLLEIHGGPASMWGPGEPTMWHEYQYFCNKGYGVVYCNPRGSGGYGTSFLRGNINDWGTGPTSDVLTSLEKTIAEGWADTSKLVITGGSYAGYLVAWIIAHDHQFKAACSQRGVYDLATFFGEGNAWRLVPNYFGGYPWDPATKATLERESPISYVQNITTPYIIFHGDNDRRTGVVQGEMMYRSLKVLGRPVEYVRHPGATHEITRSGNNRQRIDQMLRTYEFFERWIKH